MSDWVAELSSASFSNQSWTGIGTRAKTTSLGSRTPLGTFLICFSSEGFTSAATFFDTSLIRFFVFRLSLVAALRFSEPLL